MEREKAREWEKEKEGSKPSIELVRRN